MPSPPSSSLLPSFSFPSLQEKPPQYLQPSNPVLILISSVTPTTNQQTCFIKYNYNKKKKVYTIYIILLFSSLDVSYPIV